MSRPRVYVTQLPTRMEGNGWVPTVNIAPAQDFGDLIYLVPHGMNFPSAEMALEQVREGLADFQAGDFLLPMGDPMVMATAAAILGARRAPFTMLKWDRQARRYHAMLINP